MRDCPRCGRNLPEGAQSCECETAPTHAQETTERGNAQSPQVDRLPPAAEGEPEEDLIDDEDGFPEEEPVDDFDTVPEGPLEEIAFEDDRVSVEPDAPAPRQVSRGFRRTLVIIVFFVLLAAAFGVLAKLLF